MVRDELLAGIIVWQCFPTSLTLFRAAVLSSHMPASTDCPLNRKRVRGLEKFENGGIRSWRGSLRRLVRLSAIVRFFRAVWTVPSRPNVRRSCRVFFPAVRRRLRIARAKASAAAFPRSRKFPAISGEISAIFSRLSWRWNAGKWRYFRGKLCNHIASLWRFKWHQYSWRWRHSANVNCGLLL